MRQLNPLGSEAIECRGLVPRFGTIASGSALILEEDAEIAKAEIIDKDEQDMRPLTAARRVGNRCSRREFVRQRYRAERRDDGKQPSSLSKHLRKPEQV